MAPAKLLLALALAMCAGLGQAIQGEWRSASWLHHAAWLHPRRSLTRPRQTAVDIDPATCTSAYYLSKWDVSYKPPTLHSKPYRGFLQRRN